jgi:hypothetical protein
VTTRAHDSGPVSRLVPSTTRDLITRWGRAAITMRAEAKRMLDKAYRYREGERRQHFLSESRALLKRADQAEACGWRLETLWRAGHKKESRESCGSHHAKPKTVLED